MVLYSQKRTPKGLFVVGKTGGNMTKENFFKRKNIEVSVQRYLIDALGFMALGLFSSLLIGTILNTIGTKFNIALFTEVISPLAKESTGAAIGVAVAYALKAPPLVLFSSVLVGGIGNSLGGPVGSLVAVLVSTELGKMVSKETKVDILVTPSVTIITGVLIAQLVGPPVSGFMTAFGEIIMKATTMQPILMGVAVSVLVGIALTLPISSAAICMMLSLGGLAGGAATAGCCAQMIGFAVISYKDNGLGGFFAQGLGTSMLQMPNIIKNWKIWIPPTLAAAITGPIATTVFALENIPIGSGMGTSGLVGTIGTITAMEELGRGGSYMYIAIAVVQFILPAILSYVFYKAMKSKGWIKDGDMKLDL